MPSVAGHPGGAVRILLAEDHDVVRGGLRDLLRGREGWHICGEARTGCQAVDLARRLQPGVAVVDLSLPELSGLDAIRQIRSTLPQTEVAVFTMHEGRQFVGEALAAGARAYVLKSEPGARIVEAVAALARQEVFFTPRVAELVVSALLGAWAPGPMPMGTSDPLSPREREVAQFLIGGLAARGVAARLGISAKTVDTHRSAILRKLGLASTADLVRYAIRHRLLEP
jgi:DNA-binding NarL/FixJ family response regulator